MKHWNLARDPFPTVAPAFVSVAAHQTALETLLGVVGAGERFVILRGEVGIGKSTVLKQAVDRLRAPGVRIATSSNPQNEVGLLEDLRRSLRFGKPGLSTSGELILALSNAVRLIHAQRGRMIVAIDGADLLSAEVWSRIGCLDSLGHTTIIRTQAEKSGEIADEPVFIQLERLTRQESRHYLTEKLVRAGRTEQTFNARATTRLHALAMGVPRSLDRLTRAALQAGARRNEPIVTEETVACVAPSLNRETFPRLGSLSLESA